MDEGNASLPKEENRGTVSTSPQISPAWKQEVNRRLAEHRGRKGAPETDLHLPSQAPHSASQRAQQAAARVAARYASAPSYSEVLAAEARAALRAAEAASRAALEAQAAAQSLLDGIEAAQAAEPMAPIAAPAIKPITIEAVAAPRGLELVETVAEASTELVPMEMELSAAEYIEMEEPVLTVEPVEPVSIRWDPDMPSRPAVPVPMYANRGADQYESDWWNLAPGNHTGYEALHEQAHKLIEEPVEIEVVEPAQPIPANLIEFPRELVATRKARPRLAEAALADAEAGMQLSIFEVDPTEILSAELLPAEILPGEASAKVATSKAAQMAEAVPALTAREWTAPAWSGIELGEQPQQEAYELPEESVSGVESAAALTPAPVSLRLLALVVDSTLIAGSLIGAALLAATRMSALPAVRTAEIWAVAGLLIAASFYYVLFFTLARTTPGMLYARLRLSTFDDEMPTRAQRWARLAAMLVSVLPVGLGVAWSIFDEDQLCWHDRLSRTFVCSSPRACPRASS
jgi:RDD family